MLPYKVIGNKRRPTLIICNGDAGNISYQQIMLASIYTANGFNVATFDWRGFGASSEFVMDEDYLCYTEMLADYESVIKEVASQSEVDIIPLLVKVHPKGKTESNMLVPDDFPREKMPFHLAPGFRKPILIIAGDKDKRTPLWMSGKIYDALPENIDKNFLCMQEPGTEARMLHTLSIWNAGWRKLLNLWIIHYS